jgi:Cu2+-exporting ATPase
MACAARGIIPLEIEPDYRGPGITIRDGTSCATIEDAPESSPDPACPPMVVTTDGQEVGRITFRPSSRPLVFEAIRELRAAGPLAFGLLSDRPDDEVGALAAALGLDFHRGGLSSTAKADLIRSYRNRGIKVAYIGDGRLEPEAARAAHVSISIADEIDLDQDPAPVLALRPDFSWMAPLRGRSRSHVARVRTVHRAILVPNLFCVAGAFLFGFTTLSAVVITNLSTWAVYAGLPHRRPGWNRRSARQLRS